MEIQKLASILIHSQKLTASSRCDYEKEDIVAVIREAKSFSLSEINNTLSESFLILDYLNSYVKFLENNHIDISYKPTIKYIIKEGKKNEKLPFEKGVINLACDLGFKNFINDDPDSKFVDGFARASVTLKFHDDLSLRSEACKCSTEDYSTAILWSYFEKIKENDGQKVVLIKQLTEDKEIINSFLSKLKDPDINFFQSQLKDGEWYDSSFALLRKFFDESRIEILQKLSNAKEFEILIDTIKLNFQEVSIGTIEKLIDAQLFGAYVIMFNSSPNQDPDKSDENEKENEDGTEKITLKKIIDKLSIRNLGPNGDKRWDFRDEEINQDIEKTYGIHPKYDFINFSHSTRIGILNKDQSFQDFKDKFLNDVKIILNLQNEKFNIGIVVLKIMPSDYSFGVLDEDGISGNIHIKDLDAVKYIARLGSTRLPLEDQASAMKFEKSIDLLKIVNEKSFYEIVRGINDDIDDKEKTILEKPELINQLLYELNENMYIKDFKSLALDLKEECYEEETIKEITKIIESGLSKMYLDTPGLKRKAKYRPRLLSNRFIQSLENLASLYKLQNR